MFKSFLILLLLLHAPLLCAQNVLFVGNSLTYSNNMPETLEGLAKANGMDIRTQCICLPNYGLEDHVNDDLVASALKRENYDFVIFQQGPSSQGYGRESLMEYGKQLARLALENQATPAYLMVWPSMAYYQTFDGVIKNHTDAANTNQVLLIPLGLIWRRIHEQHNQYKLYGSDQFHPSSLGSLLEALVILKTLNPSVDIEALQGKAFNGLFTKEEDRLAFLKLVSAYINEL